MDFGLLGPLLVRVNGREIPLAGPRQRLVLAHLLIEANHVVPVDRLAELIWGDQEPGTARGTLQAYVSRLRRSLGTDRVESRGWGYVLHVERDETDAGQFDDLTSKARSAVPTDPAEAAALLDRALGLVRGPTLADLADEPSLRATAARLDENVLTAIEDRMEVGLALGEESALLPRLERSVTEHPLRERLWAQLMVALYRQGRQADALDLYHRLRASLQEELGVEPSPDVERLYRRILQQDPTLELRGRPIRGYELVEKIGDGAFGTVYRAVQPDLARSIAVKVIHARFANSAEFIRRFEQEARIVARLEHPHIVPLYDFWRDSTGAYVAMRYLAGGNLRDRLAGGFLTNEQVIRLVDQIAMALDAAHRGNVVHRDVRPPNILFDTDGNAYLSDFGIAKEVHSLGAGDSVIAELAYYLAPEEIRDEPITPAADTYSLGLVLYESLTGQHPFADTPQSELLERHLQGGTPSVRLVRRDLPAAVDEVLRRATASIPTDRYESPAELASAMRDALEAPPATSSAAEPLRNPYKGLRSFDEADTGDFYGRESLVQRLVDRMRQEGVHSRFLAVVGPSGSGKSSVVRAGLLPALRAGAADGSESWLITDMHPGSRPFDELAQALARISVRESSGLATALREDPSTLAAKLDELLPPGSELVLVVDQFEELFTLVQTVELCRSFLGSLNSAITDTNSRLRVIVTLRADFYDRPLLYDEFGALLADRTEAVTPMRPEEMERAIVGPAEGAGISAEPAVVSSILADFASQPGGLPLLQFGLTELFEHRTEDRLTVEGYRRSGGIVGAVGRRAERIFRALSSVDRETSRQVFLRLVTITEDGTRTRRRVRVGEITSLEVDRAGVERVIERFGRHRMLSFDRDPATREPTVELAHEALMHEWSRLRTWIDDAYEDVRLHQRLALATAEWEASGRDDQQLLAGVLLDRVGPWTQRSDLALTRAERDLIEASAARREAERRVEEDRRAREARLARTSLFRLRALLIIVATAAVVAGGLALVARQQTDLATARDLAGAAIGVLDDDPELSILLALRAADMADPPPEAVAALHRAIQASRTLCTAQVEANAPIGASVGSALSSDGRRLAITGDGASVDIWDVETCERVASLGQRTEGPNYLGLALVAFSPDDRYLFTVDRSGIGHLWDTRDRGERTWRLLDDGPGLVAFSPDGHSVAVADGAPPSVVTVWDTESLSELASWTAGWAVDIRFHPDGTHVVVADYVGNQVLLLNPADGTAVPVLADHLPPEGAAYSPDGRILATATTRGVYLWDTQTWTQLRVMSHPGAVRKAVFDPSGQSLATATDDGTIRVFDVASGRLLMTLAGQGGNPQSLSFSADGTRLASGSSSRTARVWDLTSARPGEVAGYDVGGPVIGFDMRASNLAAVLRGPDPYGIGASVVLDMLDSSQHLEIPDAGSVFGARSVPWSGVALTPDGSGVLTQTVLADANGRADGYGELVLHELWSGRSLLTLAGICPGSVDESECPTELRNSPYRQRVAHAQFSPDGHWIALAGSDGDVTLWDAAEGSLRQRAHLSPDAVASLSFSPDGASLAVAGGIGGPTVLQVPSFDVVATLPVPNTPAAQFSPDGTLLAVVSATNQPTIFRTSDWSIMHELGEFGAGWSLDFDDTGRLLVTAHATGFLHIWEVSSGRLVQSIPVGPRIPSGVAFIDGGQHILLASDDDTDAGALLVLTDDVHELIEIGRARLTRGLTDEECRVYLHQSACEA